MERKGAAVRSSDERFGLRASTLSVRSGLTYYDYKGPVSRRVRARSLLSSLYVVFTDVSLSRAHTIQRILAKGTHVTTTCSASLVRRTLPDGRRVRSRSIKER